MPRRNRSTKTPWFAWWRNASRRVLQPPLQLRRRPLPDSAWLTSEALWAAASALNPRLGAQDSLAEPLSQRELDVLEYLPGRMRNQEIAADMYVSVNTVKTHVASIYRKLGVTERDEAVKRATQLGLI